MKTQDIAITNLKNIVVERTNMIAAALSSLDFEVFSDITKLIESCIGTSRTIYVIGNGGSSTTASHFVCDWSKVIMGNKPYDNAKRLRVVSLSESTAMLTAIANDYDYEFVFSDQLEHFAKKSDVLIVLSYSGNSANVCAAAQVAKKMGIHTIALLGSDGGKAKDLVDYPLVVRTENCGVAEDIHLILMHMLTDNFKHNLCD